jgi:hypothetical protein
LSNCFYFDKSLKRRPFVGPLATGADMIMLGLYLFFLTLFTAIGAVIGYITDQTYPGSGSLIAVAVFLAAAWFAWVASVRISERFWPEPPASDAPGR